MPDVMPLVTAVIPCHNHREWINGAIESILAQDYPRLQVVVVDDGSSDDSFMMVYRRLYEVQTSPPGISPKQVVGKLQGSEVPCMAVQLPQARGPAFARNFGIQAAWNATDVYAFLDSDDTYSPGKIAKSVQIWMEDPGHIGAVYSDYDTFNPQTGLRMREFKEPFSRERLLRECIVNCDSLVSKHALQHCGVFDDSLRVCEDYELWVRLSEKFLIIHIPESLVTIRVGDHSSTSTVPNEIWQKCYARVFEKANERLRQTNGR